MVKNSRVKKVKIAKYSVPKGIIICRKVMGKLYNTNICSVMLKYADSAIQVPPKGNAFKIDKNKLPEILPSGIIFIGE